MTLKNLNPHSPLQKVKIEQVKPKKQTVLIKNGGERAPRPNFGGEKDSRKMDLDSVCRTHGLLSAYSGKLTMVNKKVEGRRKTLYRIYTKNKIPP